MRSRVVIVVSAIAAVLLRFPGLFAPPRPDEAGFALVARAWEPQPDNMFGTYFVDRPPQLIAVIRVLDAWGGVVGVRLAGALACALLVVAAAGCVRVVAGRTAAAWTAVATAAVTSNAIVDSVAVKGELLGLPLVMGSCWLTLLVTHGRHHARGEERVEDPPAHGRRVPTLVLAAGAGLLATAALGMKQNLVGGLVFGAMMLVGSAVAGRFPIDRAVRLGAAAAAGAAVPVLATVGWALAAGVHLDAVWYEIYGFRSDAFAVISAYSSQANDGRAVTLLSSAFSVGMVLIVGGFVVHLVGEWRDDAPLTAAIAVMLVVDVVALALGGSFWIAYLFTLVPGTALCAGMLVRRRSKRGIAMRVVIVATVASCLVSAVVWTVDYASRTEPGVQARTGEALEVAAEPGDTLTVFGGRADIQYLSGMDSPYEHLWSLPMRTLDPDYARLRALLSGPDAPTWLLEEAWFGSWENPAGQLLRDTAEQHYRVVSQVCGDGSRIWLHDGVERAAPQVPCDAEEREDRQPAG